MSLLLTYLFFYFRYLRDHSRTIAGKEQLIIAAMAKALEVIPRQLCDNAGFDATNMLNKLRQKHAQVGYKSHDYALIFFCFKYHTLSSQLRSLGE